MRSPENLMLDFRNVNTLWTSVVAETLHRLGLKIAVICPGSRSAPLTVAFAGHPQITTIAILDERSAAFFALGVAKRSGLPVALVCTSGTAGANFFPAVIEAKASRVPLLVLTGDRPAELRHCHAGQTIDQLKLYGNYPNWQTEIALPGADLNLLQYLRQTIIQAWEQTLWPHKGPVHLNFPFRDPLAPVADLTVLDLLEKFQPEDFFTAVAPQDNTHKNQPFLRNDPWHQCRRGIIIGGIHAAENPEAYCQAVAQLAKHLEWPVLAEALSPLRNYASLNPYLISTYDLMLRDRQLAGELIPDMVLQLGELPTSKELRAWLTRHSPPRWIVSTAPENFDPLHGKTVHLRTSVESLGAGIVSARTSEAIARDYCQRWCQAEVQTRAKINKLMSETENLIEGKIAWLLSQILPAQTTLFIANSMSVRNMEFFWLSGDRKIVPYFNRGANGIDGTLSTALGIAYGQTNSVLLTGDLALLHDTNGFLINAKFVGHLSIILINNDGGGIFETLPISQFNPPFEEYFATPQQVNFAQLCAAYGVEHQLIATWEQLQGSLNPLPTTGIRVLEIRTDRKADAQWLQTTFLKLAR